MRFFHLLFFIIGVSGVMQPHSHWSPRMTIIMLIVYTICAIMNGYGVYMDMQP